MLVDLSHDGLAADVGRLPGACSGHLGAGGSCLDRLGDDLLAERRELSRILTAAGEGAFEAPTRVQGWSVLDHLTHLAYFDDVLRHCIEDTARNASAVTSCSRGPTSLTQRVTAEFHDLRPRAALSWLHEAGRTLVSSAGGADRRQRMPWGGRDLSMASCLRMRVVETWSHVQDVYDALGRTRSWSPRLHHVAYLAVQPMSYSFRLHGVDMAPAPVRIELGGWAHGPEGSADFVTGSLEEFCLVVTRRRNLDETSLVADGVFAERWMRTAHVLSCPEVPGCT